MYFRPLPQSYTTRQCHYFLSKVKRKTVVWSSVVIPPPVLPDFGTGRKQTLGTESRNLKRSPLLIEKLLLFQITISGLKSESIYRKPFTLSENILRHVALKYPLLSWRRASTRSVPMTILPLVT